MRTMLILTALLAVLLAGCCVCPLPAQPAHVVQVTIPSAPAPVVAAPAPVPALPPVAVVTPKPTPVPPVAPVVKPVPVPPTDPVEAPKPPPVLGLPPVPPPPEPWPIVPPPEPPVLADTNIPDRPLPPAGDADQGPVIAAGASEPPLPTLEPASEPAKPSTWPWLIAVLILAGAAVGYLVIKHYQKPATATPAPATTPTAPTQPTPPTGA
jgi:protein TonB